MGPSVAGPRDSGTRPSIDSGRRGWASTRRTCTWTIAAVELGGSVGRMAPQLPMPDGVPTYHPCKAFRDGRQTQYELCVALGKLCEECSPPRGNPCEASSPHFAAPCYRLRQARLAETDARRRVRDRSQPSVHWLD